MIPPKNSNNECTICSSNFTFNLYSSKLEGLFRSLDNLTFIIGFKLEFVFNKIVNEFKMNIQLENQLKPRLPKKTT